MTIGMRHLTFLFYLLLIFTHARAVAPDNLSLQGRVTDAQGNGVPRAVVRVDGTSHAVAADDLGNFQLALPPGQYLVTISSLGYIDSHQRVNITTATRLDLVLETAPVNLHGVEVMAKSQNQTLRETALAINALDVKPQVNKATDAAMLLGRTSGLILRQEGGLGSNADLTINGLSGNAVRYFIDGIPMTTLGSGINAANLPLNLIDRIEVYKGVVPVHLGGDALGGAVNIVTNPKEVNYLDASYACGSFNTHRADLSARYHHPKTKLVVRPTLGFNHSDNNYTMHNVEVWNATTKAFERTSARRFHDAYTSAFGRVEVGVTRTRWADALRVAASAAQSHNEIQTGTVQSVVYGQAATRMESSGVSVIYQKNDFLTPRLSTNLSYAFTSDHETVIDTVYRKYRWDGTYTNSSGNERYGRARSLRRIHRPQHVADLGLTYPLNDHHSLTLHYSLNAIRNRRTDDVDPEFVPSTDRFDKHITGLSYRHIGRNRKMEQMLFVKNYTSRLEVQQQDLYWITGAKEMGGHTLTTHWGGGLALRYAVADALALKASFERAVRLPLAREMLGDGINTYPNLQLTPEQSFNANLGLQGTLRTLPGHRLEYETNGFVRKVDDYIRMKITEAEGMSQYQNVDNVLVTGIDGELRYVAGRTFDLAANACYLYEVNKTRTQDNGKPEVTYNNRMPNRPWLYANGMANLHLYNPLNTSNTRLTLSYDLRYVHWFYLTWEGYGVLKSKSIIPTQWVSNAALTCSLHNGRYNLSFNVNNLLDRTVYDNFMLQKPGRHCMVKLRVYVGS